MILQFQTLIVEHRFSPFVNSCTKQEQVAYMCVSDVESCGGILITVVYRDGPGASIGR